MAQYELRISPSVLRGRISRELPPILTIQPGDTVCYSIPDAVWGLEPYPDAASNQRRCVEPHNWEQDAGHCLAGPVAIRGAKPGQTLAVDVGEIVPGGWGWTEAGGWPAAVNDPLELTDLAPLRLLWQLDRAAGVATDQFGHRVPLRPFLGILSLAPAAPGDHPTTPPHASGGNLDCRELVAGATLYLPVAVEGGFFFCGDGHAAQGDGEVCGTAIECLIERADLTFRLVRDLPCQRPLAHTPVGWLTFGLDPDLTVATYQAVNDLLDLMVRRFGLARQAAAALASTAVSLRITQLVNDVRGVHALLPHDVIGRLPPP
jgi:acetamidase/formamidase